MGKDCPQIKRGLACVYASELHVTLNGHCNISIEIQGEESKDFKREIFHDCSPEDLKKRFEETHQEQLFLQTPFDVEEGYAILVFHISFHFFLGW